MHISEKMSAAAATVTRELLKFSQPADGVLSAFFKAQRTGSRERAFIAETAYAVLRRKRLLERLVGNRNGEATPRQLVLASLVRIAGISQRQLEEALTPGEAEWLLALKTRPELELTLAEKADFPDWLVTRLNLPETELLALARGLNQSAPLDLRVNSLKATREEVQAALAGDGLEAEPCPR